MSDDDVTGKFYFPAYFALLAVALIIVVIVWEVIAPGRWFYCDDVVFTNFFPPFAHTDPAIYGHNEDRYYVDPRFVYSVWSSLVAAAFIVPAAVVAMQRSAGRAAF